MLMSLPVAVHEPTKTMQVRWGFWSPRTEHTHYNRRRTGSRTVCTKRTARYESTRTARRVYDVPDTSRGHDLYVPRTQSNGSYQKEERKRERVVDGRWTGFKRSNWAVMEGSPMVSEASWFVSRRWAAVQARGQDWSRYETERDSTKDFARVENDRENETDSVKTKADGTTFLFLFYNGT